MAYQLLFQGCQGRLEPLLLRPHHPGSLRACVDRSDRHLPVHPQCPAHHVALSVLQQMQLLQPGQSSLQSLPDPAAVYSGCSAHHPRTRPLPAQHAGERRPGISRNKMRLKKRPPSDCAPRRINTVLLTVLLLLLTCLVFKLPVRINLEFRGETELLPTDQMALLPIGWPLVSNEHLVLILPIQVLSGAAQACTKFICIIPHGTMSILLCYFHYSFVVVILSSIRLTIDRPMWSTL